MKYNDKGVPKDEMLLAAAIAAAESNGLRWTSRACFRDEYGLSVNDPENAASCCALGALHVAGLHNLSKATPPHIAEVVTGNDRTNTWATHSGDHGESLGWAFRCAMTQEEP